MSSSNIITSQFVQISISPASIGSRIWARCIDYLALGIYDFAMYQLINLMTSDFYSGMELSTILIYALLIIPNILYTFLCEAFSNGQTLGKYCMKIKVVMKDGSQPTVSSYFMRWILELVDIYTSCIGLFVMIINKDGQRFGDITAGTMVIKVSDNDVLIPLDEFFYAKRDYKPSYPEAKNLSQKQIEIIEKAINIDYDEDKAEKLTDKVTSFLNIKSKDNNNLNFLTVILHDYQYYELELV